MRMVSTSIERSWVHILKHLVLKFAKFVLKRRSRSLVWTIRQLFNCELADMIEKVELDLPEHNETKLSYQSVSERTLNKRVTSILHDA